MREGTKPGIDGTKAGSGRWSAPRGPNLFAAWTFLLHSPKKEHDMDKDRIAGAAKQAKGAVKDAAGKLMGDSKLQAEGKADKIEGKVQNTAGSLKDKAREALDD
jgi:uncharacterized protein YjbJ (UPF0337 family)